ncbi:MAG TPA: hypothetical protein VIK25_03780 [Gemmatimonadaceae bacterium]
MTKFIRVALAPLAPLAPLAFLGLVAVFAACGNKDQATPDSHQVELTPAPSAQPQLADTAVSLAPAPAAERPAATAPAPKPARKPAPRPAPTPVAAEPPVFAPVPGVPAPSAPTTGVIAGGLSLATTLGTRVCTNTHKVGDQVTATLASGVSGTNGALIPAGATVTLRVSESQRGENGKEGIRLAFEPVSVTFAGVTYTIDGSAVMTQMQTVRAQTTGDQAKKVVGGAVIGAIAGQILGKRAKTAAIGAAVGAAAGGVVAAGTADWNGCLAEGANLTVTLTSPVTVKVGAY